MLDTDNHRGILFAALGDEMRTARQAKTAVPVRGVGQRIISVTNSDPLLLEDVIDALCTLCIRSGLTIEFSRPTSSADH